MAHNRSGPALDSAAEKSGAREADPLGKFEFEAIRSLKSELFGVRYEFSMFKLGLYTAHGRGEAMVSIVSVGVPSLSGDPSSKHLVCSA